MSALLIVALGAKVVIDRLDRADPVDVDAVVADFDASNGAARSGRGDRPLAPGAQRFDATGTEYVDVLGGPLHEFPDEVVETIEDNDCGGSTIRVQLFTQRDDVLRLCRIGDGSWSLDAFTTRHEFVGIEDETVTTCEENELWTDAMFDDSEDSGSDIEIECTATGPNVGTTRAIVTRRVHPPTAVQFEGTEVRASRVEITSTIRDPGSGTEGTYENNLWIAEDRTVVRRTLDARVTTPTPVGSVSFEETFDLTRPGR